MIRKLSPLALFGVTACSLAPNIAPPHLNAPTHFAEASGWQPANPSDQGPRGDWWTLFNDPTLNDLEGRVVAANQTVAQAVAAYDQARSLVRETRSGLLPSVSYSGSATKSSAFNGTAANKYAAGIGATWEPDVFGQLRSGLSQNKFLAQASAGDLGNVILAAQGELALNYEQLRAVDAQRAVLATTVAAYQRALMITDNRYTQGVVAKLDVLQAETQLRNAKGDAVDLERQRTVLVHAVAVLVGENPSSYALAETKWDAISPEVPAILPAQLLERRPDVAAAERRVMAANQSIGIARGAFFPTLTLTSGANTSTSALSSLFASSTNLWSLGANIVGTLLDFGGRSARVAEARAAYDITVAKYKQTALTAFQQTEDELAAAHYLAAEAMERQAASVAADRVEAIKLNQYKAGIAGYSDVITAQTTALTARRAAITALSNRQQAAVSLIQAIGGGWRP